MNYCNKHWNTKSIKEGKNITKHIFDKIALKNTENLSSHNFTNDYTLGISNNIDGLKINDDASNEEVLSDLNIEGVKGDREEERKLEHNKEGKILILLICLFFLI